MMRKVYFLTTFFLLFLGCRDRGGSNEYIPSKDGKVIYSGTLNNDIRVHIGAEPRSLHVAERNITTNYLFVAQYIHQSLIRISIENGELLPQLAKAMPAVSGDNLRYTFEMAPEAKWEDGTAMTAKDVAFSMKIHFSPFAKSSAIRSFLADFEGMEIDPNNELKFTFTFKQASVLTPYFATNFYIVDRRFYDPENVLDKYSLLELLNNKEKVEKDEALKAWTDVFYTEKYLKDPAFIKGTGPYELSQWDAEQQIILTRKENYWGKDKAGKFHSQYPDRIVFKVVREETTAALEMQNQNLDLSLNLSTPMYVGLKKNQGMEKNWQLRDTVGNNVVLVMFNHDPDGIKHAKLFNQKALREVIRAAIPIDNIMAEYLEGMATRANSIVPISHLDSHSDLDMPKYDLAFCREVLDKEGWKDTDGDEIRDKVIDGKKTPLRFNLSYPQSSRNDDIFGRIGAALKEVGIQCDMEPLALNDLAQKLYGRDFDLAALALPALPVPYPFEQMWLSTNYPNKGNFTGFRNADLDTEILKARTAFDPEERKKITKKIHETFYEEVAFVPMYTPLKKAAIHKRYSRAELYPTRMHVYLNDWEVVRE